MMEMDREDLLACQIARRLARSYRANRASIAALCDGQIDRSGNLLGWLREFADLTDEASPETSPSPSSRGSEHDGD